MKSIRNIAASFGVAALVTVGSIGCGGGGSEASFCSTLKQWQSDVDKIETGEPGSESFADGMKKAQEALDDLKSSAPDEISDDVQTLSDAMGQMADLDLSDPSNLDPSALQVDEKKVDEASKNIEEYAKNNCDIDLNEE